MSSSTSSSTNRSLTKSTLGLKFMNKTVPVVVPRTPTAAPPATPAPVAVAVPSPAPAATATPTRIIHEASLLSFPLLASTQTTQHPLATVNYSIMLKTSMMISGRRSFGGANVQIEHMENPPAPSVSTAPREMTQHEQATALRNKRKTSSTTLSLAHDREGSKMHKDGSTTFAGAGQASGKERAAAAEGGRGLGKAKKVKREDEAASAASTSSSGFTKPAGYDDALAARPSSSKKKNQRNEKGGRKSSGVEVEPVWKKQGEQRDWDAGKEEDDESASDDSSDDSSKEEEEMEEEEIENAAKMLRPAAAARGSKSGKKVRRGAGDDDYFDEDIEMEEAVDRAIEHEERGFDQGEETRSSSKSKSKKLGKKVRRD